MLPAPISTNSPTRPSAFNPGLHTLAAKLHRLTGTKPILESKPPAQHGIHWTCPKTGILIPKTKTANLEWRRKLLGEAAMSEDLQSQLRAACTASAWFWINAFVWTFRQKRVNEDGEEVPCLGHEAHHPFVTWLVQDEFIGELQTAIEGGHDVLIDKSRDMGASWLCLTVLHWFWQFRPSTTFLELSRKEELVDKKGSMDCLFEKHRYINRWQPSWLRPRRINDKYMHLGNGDNGSSIEGESTNGDAGRGGRKTAILCDEFAAVPNGDEVDAATADTTACRIYNSTPKGPGTQHHRIFEQKRARILILPWWRHPEKGNGAYQYLDERGRAKWTGPWHKLEAARRDPKHMAQEVDMDHGKAGDMFFDADDVERHRRAHESAPTLTGNLALDGDYGDEAKAKIIARRDPSRVGFTKRGERQAWRFWIPLVNGRPPQDLTYVFGIDVSNGAGGSNSVISVVADEAGLKVAEFASAFVSPEELGEQCVFAALWFGGARPAYLVWENNGPGGIFGRKVVKLGYSHFYFQRQDGVKQEGKTPRWGWHSNQQRKEVLLARYREALFKDQIINPCTESLTEILDYVYDENGLLMPGKFKEETNGGRALHGDRVIADALTVLGRDELPKSRHTESNAPQGSFAARKQHHEKKLKQADEWRV